MTGGREREAHRKALRLFHSGLVGDPALRREGKIEAPLPVQGPDGAPAGWFVPVTVGAKLAGFFQFDAEMHLLRYSGFQRRPGAFDDCPDAKAWLDPERIGAVARRKFPDGKVLGQPVLTYDQAVTRIVWAVKLERPTGRQETVYVAGDYAYPAGGPQ